MIVIDNSSKNEYYTYTDQLGSILTVTADDYAATVVAQQDFDAWGRNRNPTDWSYTEASTPNFQAYNYRCPTGVPNWLYRGYTGHEMLPEFGLINMNGRMYDPLLGRMLSPDNQVQQPYGTQAYNRYSYASNNPLKNTDPSGWTDGNPWQNAGQASFSVGDYIGDDRDGAGSMDFGEEDPSLGFDNSSSSTAGGGEQVNNDGAIVSGNVTISYFDGLGNLVIKSFTQTIEQASDGQLSAIMSAAMLVVDPVGAVVSAAYESTGSSYINVDALKNGVYNFWNSDPVRAITGDVISVNFGAGAYVVGGTIDFNFIIHGPRASILPNITYTLQGGLMLPGPQASLIRYNLLNPKVTDSDGSPSFAPADKLTRDIVTTDWSANDPTIHPAQWFQVGSVIMNGWQSQDGSILVGGGGIPSLGIGVSTTSELYDLYSK